MERLQKVIANSGYCSRRKAEELIKQGKVLVNNQKITELGFKVNSSDVIRIENKILKKEDKEYILLYKPRGVITTTNDELNRKTILDLIETDKRLYPVGRLDYDTSGLIILTNDGNLTNILTHPKNNIDKVYIAKINGIMNKEQIKLLEKGIIIDNKKTSPCKVKVRKKEKDSSIVELTIHEGRNHQVKKMFEAIGFNVLKLKREKLAFLNLNGLKPGEYRYLSIKEVKMLYSLK